MPRTILIADDHLLFAEGIVHLLSDKYEVIGSALNGRTLVEEAKRLNPDIVLADIAMPELNGIEAIRQLGKFILQAKIVIVTQHLHPAYVRAAFAAGAKAFVAKQAASSELITAIEAALANRYFVSEHVNKEAAEVASADPGHNPAEYFGGKLTPRQREVLQLVAEGRSTKEISARLHISPKTVEFHRNSIMDELGIRSIAELTRYAIAQGIVSTERF